MTLMTLLSFEGKTVKTKAPVLVIALLSLCLCFREMLYCLLMSVFFLTCDFVIYDFFE